MGLSCFWCPVYFNIQKYKLHGPGVKNKCCGPKSAASPVDARAEKRRTGAMTLTAISSPPGGGSEGEGTDGCEERVEGDIDGGGFRSRVEWTRLECAGERMAAAMAL